MIWGILGEPVQAECEARQPAPEYQPTTERDFCCRCINHRHGSAIEQLEDLNSYNVPKPMTERVLAEVNFEPVESHLLAMTIFAKVKVEWVSITTGTVHSVQTNSDILNDSSNTILDSVRGLILLFSCLQAVAINTILALPCGLWFLTPKSGTQDTTRTVVKAVYGGIT